MGRKIEGEGPERWLIPDGGVRGWRGGDYGTRAWLGWWETTERRSESTDGQEGTAQWAHIFLIFNQSVELPISISIFKRNCNFVL